jgi:hypothetical protein
MKDSTKSGPFISGPDELDEGADYVGYGISLPNWARKIVVYGDPDLRDHVLDFLNTTAIQKESDA